MSFYDVWEFYIVRYSGIEYINIFGRYRKVLYLLGKIYRVVFVIESWNMG